MKKLIRRSTCRPYPSLDLEHWSAPKRLCRCIQWLLWNRPGTGELAFRRHSTPATASPLARRLPACALQWQATIRYYIGQSVDNARLQRFMLTNYTLPAAFACCNFQVCARNLTTSYASVYLQLLTDGDVQ